ncbi:ROK family transcriptional regulator [Pseudomonas gingeri]|uniref:ROK family transcriptional regulator n=3 Tax=Pseudomonas gingeri TaxID=117681 RepID=A0A7Y7YD74_9PSED|nr:ROK family transcriptional regulator [Pseudomonas gingeri]NWA01552.1 ROK family transcriptional regulator [Pseudomonas gingeri]NWA13645.1 ROK family transcriptional regulator [Pseudomonas gingeri]NWA52995.1 ROK family transcriptional regulator [Pseudomonas gingeri]NWA96492.1 ROK family transcriptional regulator [Pseudomonas gingeri]NWA99871.1 ROK family transcriptional regulator [Pseudomonas gingeri]
MPTRIEEMLSPNSAGAILNLIHTGKALTRAAIMEVSGLSRSTVTQRLDTLLANGYIRTASHESSTGGRPSGRFEIDKDFGVMLVADIGAQQMRIALSDMHGQMLLQEHFQIEINDGPEHILGAVEGCFLDLLGRAGKTLDDVRGIGIGIPSPVEFATGTLVRPPLMIGWDGCCVPDFFRATFDCPIVLDKDVNLMALGEHRQIWPTSTHLMFLTISTGIGAGLVMDGRLQRGAQGAAGDIGHLFVGNTQLGELPLCRCGNTGCLEAYASGWAISKQLQADGYSRAALSDITAMARQGQANVVNLLQSSGRFVGEALAQAVSLINPSLVVLGGVLAECQDHLLAGVRETIYRRSLPLATRDLQVVSSQLGDLAALHGAAHLVRDQVYAPAAVNRYLARAG